MSENVHFLVNSCTESAFQNISQPYQRLYVLLLTRRRQNTQSERSVFTWFLSGQYRKFKQKYPLVGLLLDAEFLNPVKAECRDKN